MDVVDTSCQLMARTENGVLTEPVLLAPNCLLWVLNCLTSLAGVVFSPGVRLYGLTGLTSLAGVVLKEDCWLFELSGLTSMAGLVTAPACRLLGLPGSLELELPADVGESELQILRQIPPARCDMMSWHCGTSHCLAGWAQVLSDREDQDTLKVGRELLPSVAHLFWAPNTAVRRLLTSLQ